MTTTTAHTATYVKHARTCADRVRKLKNTKTKTSRPGYRNETIKFNDRQYLHYENKIMGIDANLVGLVHEERDLLDRIAERRANRVECADLVKRSKNISKRINAIIG